MKDKAPPLNKDYPLSKTHYCLPQPHEGLFRLQGILLWYIVPIAMGGDLEGGWNGDFLSNLTGPLQIPPTPAMHTLSILLLNTPDNFGSRL